MPQPILRPDAPERDIQAAICNVLGWCNLRFTVTDASRVWSMNGRVRRNQRNAVTRSWPDVTVVLPPMGRALLLEVKRPKGRTSDGQAELHEQLREDGALVAIVRSVDDVLDILRGYAEQNGAEDLVRRLGAIRRVA